MSSSQIPALRTLIDSHVHLDFPLFDADREDVLARSYANGVSALVVPGVQSVHWGRIKELSSRFERVFPCYGLHPCFVQHHQQSDLDMLRQWLSQESAVAVGECGLDFYQDYVKTESEQCLYFEGQLSLASEFSLPVILHARRSVDAVLKCIRQAGLHRGVMHSFSGSAQQAKAAVDQGLMIGVGGAVTHERAKKLRSVIAALPLDAIVLETDAPDQSGAMHRGQRNEPAYLVEVLDVLVSLRSESRDVIAVETTKNSRSLFALEL